jgi:hypothetical protein
MTTGNIEFIIWGIPPSDNHEQVLHTLAENREAADNIASLLESNYGCRNTRVQVLDLNKAPDFANTLNI